MPDALKNIMAGLRRVMKEVRLLIGSERELREQWQKEKELRDDQRWVGHDKEHDRMREAGDKLAETYEKKFSTQNEFRGEANDRQSTYATKESVDGLRDAKSFSMGWIAAAAVFIAFLVALGFHFFGGK